MAKITPIPPVEIPKLPSADLINYRFDQIDGSFKEIKDTLRNMQEQAVPRSEIMMMKKERDDKIMDIQDQVDELKANNKWWFRSIITALLLAIASFALTFLVKK